MKTYDVTVTRDGRWWMVEIPELDVLTQARRLSEVEEMARSLIAVTLDTPLSRVKLGAMSIYLAENPKDDLSDVSARVAELRAEAQRAETSASELMRATAVALAEAEIPVRDIGEVLGVSYQRASQLANT